MYNSWSSKLLWTRPMYRTTSSIETEECHELHRAGPSVADPWNFGTDLDSDHLHHFSKIKSHAEVTKQYLGIYVFLTIFADDRRIRIRIREAQKQLDPTDPDPQQWHDLSILSLQDMVSRGSPSAMPSQVCWWRPPPGSGTVPIPLSTCQPWTSARLYVVFTGV